MDLWAALNAAEEAGIFECQGRNILLEAGQIQIDSGKNETADTSKGEVANPSQRQNSSSTAVGKIRKRMESKAKKRRILTDDENRENDRVSEDEIPIETTIPVQGQNIATSSASKAKKRHILTDDENRDHDSVSEGQEVIASKSGKGKKRVVKQCENKPEWFYLTQFTINSEHWNKLHVGMELDDKYVEYFTDYLMNEVHIACVLKSGGPFIGYGLFNFRFECTNGPCRRKFVVKQIADSNFKLLDNGEPENHDGNEQCRHVRNVKRQIVSQGLVKMNPEDYLMFCQKGLNRELYERGHLQDLVSVTTATKMRNDELIKKLDYDKDDIIDLLKMKLSDDYKMNVTKETSDIFIRRINLDPFAVLMCSNDQLKLLKQLGEENDNLKLFFDSTGSVARHAKKRVFYYGGVCCIKKNRNDDKEKARLQPMLEMLSGEHDAQNLRLLLEDVRHNFEVKYPHQKWPIRYTITDFSYALLNAICRAWNGVKLLKYINLTYKFANDPDFKNKLSEFGIETFLQLCCGHFSKTQCNDVAKYFPNLDNQLQTLLKEIFISMYDISDLNQLRIIWTNLSTILLSKYVDENVELALKTLTDVSLNHKSQNKKTASEEGEGMDDNDDDEMPCDDHKFDAIYKQSEFYKDFSKATYKPQFQMGTQLNVFYNIEFSGIFLKKYISILCFWTCITQTHRKSNAPQECHFKNTKGRLKRKAVEIGALPLKAGRLCRELQKYTMSTTEANLCKFPRKNNCYKQATKRKLTDDEDEPVSKKTKRVDGDSILSLYKAVPKVKTPKTSRTPKTPKTPRTTAKRRQDNEMTPTGISKTIVKTKLQYDVADDVEDVRIDDLCVTEEWYKRRPARYTHMNKKVLRDINSKSAEDIKKMLTKHPKGSGKGLPTGKLSNGLVDNPDMYLKPSRNYAISRIGKKILYRDEYALLSGSSVISNELINYIWTMFQNTNKNIQFEQKAFSSIIKGCSSTVFKIKSKLLIALHDDILILVNCVSKTFGYVDPKATINPDEEIPFKNFTDYLALHNTKYANNKVNTEGWTIRHYEHAICDESHEMMIYIFRYIQQFCQENKIDGTIKGNQFRTELLQTILWRSMSMTGMCIECGLADLPQNDAKTLTPWVECNSCKRWTHLECINMEMERVDVVSVNYFCVVCQANTAACAE